MLSLLRRPAPWPLARLTEEVSNDWLRFRQASNSIYEDVAEAQVTVTGTATVTGGKIIARPASPSNWAAMNTVTFNDNENFYIRVTAKPDAPASDIVTMPYLGIWGAQASPESAWLIHHCGPAHPTNPGKIVFAYRASDGTIGEAVSPDATPYTNTTTVEAVRLNGVVTLLIDGAVKASFTQTKGNGKAAFPALVPFRLSTGAATYVMAGEVYDIIVAKGDKTYVNTNHTVTPVGEYKRPAYFQATADKIVAQYGFRKNSLAEEKSGNSGTISGNTIMVRGHIRTDNTNASRYELPCPYFGAGDFTIECMVKALALPASDQFYMLAQYYRGSAVPHADDSWNLQYGGATSSPNTIRFVYYDETNTKKAIFGPGTQVIGAQYHVVVERVDGVMTIYVDGVAGQSVPFSAPLREVPTKTVTSFVRDPSITTLFGPHEIWNVRIAKAALFKGNVVRKATFPSFSASTAFPVLTKKLPFTAMSMTMAGGGSVVQLSHLAYNEQTKKLYLPMLHSDRTSRMGIYDVNGDVLSSPVSPTHATMGGSGVIRFGAMQSISRERNAATGKYAAIHTWGTSGVPSGLEIGAVNESTRQMENITTSTASIVGAISNLNLQAGVYLDPTGSFGLAQYIDGNSDRYIKFRKFWYDEVAGKFAMGTSAQEFVGQQYPIAPRFYKDSMFVSGGTASTGQAYVQLLDVSGATPVQVAAISSIGAPGLSWGRCAIEIIGDYIVLLYLESGVLKVELFRYEGGSTFVRLDAAQLGGFATTSTFNTSDVLQDTGFFTIYNTGSQADMVKVTVSNGKLVRVSADRQMFLLDSTYNQVAMAKISDTRLVVLRYAGSGACQYSFLDYTWRSETVPTKVAALFRYDNDEPIEEASERYAPIFGTATTANGRLNTTSVYTSRQDSDAIYFGAGEDFTIEGRMYMTAVGSDGVLLAGIWTSGGQLGNSWSVHVRSPDGKLGFYYSIDGSNYLQIVSDATLFVNTEYHLAVWRRDGTIRMAINGVVQSQILNDNRACYRAPRLMSTSWIGTNGHMAGWRDDLRICREALYGDTDFVPPTPGLADAPRPVYSAAEATACILQLGLRRESLEDEASTNVLTFTSGTSMANGRITQTNSNTSQYTIASRQFGAGDFCAEMMLNVSAINATYGAVIMGNWRAGGVASDNNRWCLILAADRKLAFNMARSANANDFAALISDAVVPLNTDTHICVERVNGVVTLYLNGQPVATSNATDFNFPIRGGASGWKVHSISEQVAYAIGMTCWNHRIMDKAMYKGAFTPPVVYPAMPVKEYVIIDHDQVASDFSLVGGAVATADGVSLPPGGYLSGVTNPKYVHYRGDFTIEATLTIRSTVNGTGAGAGNHVTSLFCWHTWGASGQPLNYEWVHNHTANTLGFNTSYSDSTVNRSISYAMPLGTKLNLKVVKKRNMLYFFVNDAMIYQTTHPINIGYDTAQPIYIGRRRGGGSGEVNWFCDCLIEKYVIAKEARM